MKREQAIDRFAREDEEHGVQRDSRGHEPPFVRHEHRLAEDLARPESRDRQGALEHVDGTRNDEIERVWLIAGFVARLSLGECDLPEQLGDPLALRRREAAQCGPREKALVAARTQHDAPTATLVGLDVARPRPWRIRTTDDDG